MVRALDWGSRSRESESHHSDDAGTRTIFVWVPFLISDFRFSRGGLLRRKASRKHVTYLRPPAMQLRSLPAPIDAWSPPFAHASGRTQSAPIVCYGCLAPLRVRSRRTVLRGAYRCESVRADLRRMAHAAASLPAPN